jgi:hypothetical protein
MPHLVKNTSISVYTLRGKRHKIYSQQIRRSTRTTPPTENYHNGLDRTILPSIASSDELYQIQNRGCQINQFNSSTKVGNSFGRPPVEKTRALSLNIQGKQEIQT